MKVDKVRLNTKIAGVAVVAIPSQIEKAQDLARVRVTQAAACFCGGSKGTRPETPPSLANA
jgi:hypothetical protein